MGIFKNLFGVDLRGLAVFRICLGFLLICDALIRLSSVNFFFTDRGVMPRSLQITYFAGFTPSLHMASGETWFQVLLFALAIACAGALLIGYRTRTATFLSWILYASVWARNPKMLNGGDQLLLLMLFWSLFLPLGARYSWDSRRTPPSGGAGDHSYFSVASAGILIQTMCVYYVSALTKIGSSWIFGDALYYAYNLDHLCRPIAKKLLGYPKLLKLLTHATLAYEYIGPVLLIYPFKPAFIRTLAVAGFFALHLGIASTMSIGWFPFMDMISLIPFLPAGFWNFWERRLGPNAQRNNGQKKAEPPSGRLSSAPWLVNAVAGFFLVYVLWWNIGELRPKLAMPFAWKKMGLTLKLNQRWNMFCKVSGKTQDGWFVVVGVLSDGRTIDLYRGGAPVSWEKPADIAAEYKDFRHQHYMAHLVTPGTPKALLSRYCIYVRDMWQKKLAAQNLRLKEIQLYFMEEKTAPDYGPSTVTKKYLWRLDVK